MPKTRTLATVGSRAFEALTGATLGGAAGGVAGALAYEPRRPREWTDEYGNIYARPLSSEEKNTRLQIAAAAALAGALGGSALSVGGSGLLRARVTALEREAAEQTGRDFLNPLKELIEDWKGTRDRFLTNTPNGASSNTGKQLKKRVEQGRIMLRKEEGRVKGLVNEAASRRAALPFVGGLGKIEGSPIDWRRMSHEGVVGQHFDQLAKKQGYGEMNLDNAYKVFSDAVESKLTKTSAVAFFEELEKIATYGAPKWGGSLRLAMTPLGVSAVGKTPRGQPRAASLDATTGQMRGFDPSQGAKMRNNVQLQQPLQPVQVAKPPMPNPTPGE